MEQLTGIPAEDAIGKPIEQLVPGITSTGEDQLLRNVINGAFGTAAVTAMAVTRSGGASPFTVQYCPFQDAEGRVRGGVGIVRDASALAEEQSGRLLAEELVRIGHMLSAELDAEKLVQAVTDKATALTGAQFGAFFYNVQDEQGESYMLYTLSGVPREAFERFPMPRNTSLFGPTFRGEGTIRLADATADPRYGKSPPYYGMPKGHLPVRSYLAVPVVSRSGEVLGGLFFGHPKAGVFTKAHERVVEGIAAHAAIAIDNARLFESADRQRKAAEAAQHEAQRSSDELKQFAYVASHDLQEPLRTIASYTQLLMSRYATHEDRDAREFSGYVIAAVSRLKVLIEDLLALSRLGTGDRQPVHVDMNRVVAAVVRELREPMREAGAEVVSTRLPQVYADYGQMLLLMLNLVGNAVKYRGDRKPCIQVAAERNNREWTFTVRDNGIGIEPQYHDRIFGVFQRLHGSEYPGTGIGLAICKKIVEGHGGQIWVESEEGAGSAFRFTLPA